MHFFIHQRDSASCGPTCLCMITKIYGNTISLLYLTENSFISKDGVSLYNLNILAQKIGFETHTVILNLKKLKKNIKYFPCILYWNQNHFVVLLKIYKGVFRKTYYYKIADPAHGIIILKEQDFKKSWITNEQGIALFLKPTENFYNLSIKDEKVNVYNLLRYLKPFVIKIVAIIFFLFISSFFSFIFPFLTQKLIDNGIGNSDKQYVIVVLLAQLTLFLGIVISNIIRNWFTLYIGTKISVNILAEFFYKFFKLPLKYFESKTFSDFNQRIRDNDRVEKFLTTQSLITFFSLIMFIVYFTILCIYNFKVLLIYLILTIISVLWSIIWIRKINLMDYQYFQEKSKNQNLIYDLFNGAIEIKINQLNDYKINKWKKKQTDLFKLNIKSLKMDQIQLSGFEFINQLKNIFVSFFVAILVIDGKLSLGIMMSITYIIGQMNEPINDLINFIKSFSEAKLSLERMEEVKNNRNEVCENDITLKDMGDIKLENVSFQYDGYKSPYVLKKLNATIPKGKITAIIGSSGSGKTTLMKILMKFYLPTKGNVFIDKTNLNKVNAEKLRNNYGVVMQDGYIFSDTLEMNISCGVKSIDTKRIDRAIKVANLSEVVDNLPQKLNTKIGSEGYNLSGGQKQRILIARAVYKNPEYLFFDEATSALDSENERIIHNNLQEFFKGKTVIIIAHRLSTVKNADQIIVLKKGQIVETGNHNQLVKAKSEYYNLVKNQLELGT